MNPPSDSVSDRRRFLKSAAAFAAAPLVVRGQTTTPATRKIKLGVVGCGGRGAWIAGLFREHGGYEMHAVADYFPGSPQPRATPSASIPAAAFPA